MKTRAFTLIELLIVVSIIGVLATIAIFNLWDAHIRAQIAQSQVNIKNLDLAIRQLMLDTQVMLVDWNDRIFPWSKERIEKKFHGVGGGKFPPPVGDGEYPPPDFRMVLMPLTSPIPYLNSVPNDPFITEQHSSGSLWEIQAYGTYVYNDNDPAEPTDGDMLFGGYCKHHDLDKRPTLWDPIPIKEGEYIIHGMGPKCTHVSINGEVVHGYIPIPYQSTNGVFSNGLLILHSNIGLLSH